MAAPAKRTGTATYADLEDLPANMVGEIVDGELYASPRPAPRHALATSSLLGDLRDFARGGDGPGGWVILVEPELHIDGQVMVPDIAGWRRERMTALPETAFFETAPDWICEVLSPSTALLDRRNKMPHYARSGVEWAWLVDPVARSVEVFHCPGGAPPWVLVATHGEGDRARMEPFELLELDLAGLWTP